MSDPYFSIVIPSYNRATTIGATLDSLWRQTCQDFEIILIDDGSTDNTLEVLNKISDERLICIRQENSGPARARNQGMYRATGRYIAFLDSDDCWFPDHLSQAQQIIRETNAIFLYSQIIVDRGVGKYWLKPVRAMASEEDIFDYLFIQGGFIQTSTIIVEKTTRETVKWNETVTYGDNDQYVIDLFLAGVRPVMMPVSQTLYADAISKNALSQLPVFGGNSKRYTNFFDYMDSRKEFMSDKAKIAFSAYVESVADAGAHPGMAFKKILAGWRSGVLSVSSAVRQLIQCFMPRVYRRLVDFYVRLYGKKLVELMSNYNSL